MYSSKPVNGASVRAPLPPCQVKSGQYWPSLLSIVRDQMRGRTNLSHCLHHTWTPQPYSGTHCSSSWGSLGATDDAEIPQPYPPRNPGLWNAHEKVFSAGVGRHMAFLAAPAAETSAFIVISASEVPSTSFSPQPSSNAGWHLTFVENQLFAGDLLSVPFSTPWCDLCGRQVLKSGLNTPLCAWKLSASLSARNSAFTVHSTSFLPRTLFKQLRISCIVNWTYCLLARQLVSTVLLTVYHNEHANQWWHKKILPVSCATTCLKRKVISLSGEGLHLNYSDKVKNPCYFRTDFHSAVCNESEMERGPGRSCKINTQGS